MIINYREAYSLNKIVLIIISNNLYNYLELNILYRIIF